MRLLLIMLSFFTPINEDSFESAQLKFDRVQQAYSLQEKAVNQKLSILGIDSNFQLYIRIFKHEKIVECWVANINAPFQLYATFPICKASGELGPKRQQGDYQVPEGFYEIAVFNPKSLYFLSLGTNYPNASDSILSTAADKGGDIYIHGDCESIGCVAISDFISELYVLAVKAKNTMPNPIQVHIFPFKMNEIAFQQKINDKRYKNFLPFWRNLQEGFIYFEKNRIVPLVFIDKSGKYLFE